MYKLLDADYFRILHVRWTILTPLIIPLCNSHCLRNLSQKKFVSINYLRCFRQKMGLHHWARQSVRQKVQGRARRGTGSFELNPGLHELKPTTRQTRHITLTLHEISDCTCPVWLLGSQAHLVFEKLAQARAQIWWSSGFENSLTGVLGRAQVFEMSWLGFLGVAQVFKNPWLGPLRGTQIFRKICAPWGFGV